MRFDGLIRSATLVAWFAMDAFDSLLLVAEEGPSSAEDDAGLVGGIALLVGGVPCCEA